MAFNKTMAAAFAATGFTSSERHVLLELCNRSDKSGRLFPSHLKIATATGLSRATVIRALKVLEAAGWVHKARRRRKDGTRTTDLITVRAPAVVAAPDRLLPLMAVVSSTPAHKVAPCDSDKVAPCDLAPVEQGGAVQQQNPITQEFNLRGQPEPLTASPVDEAQRQEIGRMMASLSVELSGRRRVA